MTQPQKPLSLADEIRLGLEQCIQHVQGEIQLKTTTISAAAPANWLDELTKLRDQHQLSRNELAQLLNITTKTLKGWEEGTSHPSRVAVRLIQVLQRTPEIVVQFVK